MHLCSDFFHHFGNGTCTRSTGKNSVVFPLKLGKSALFSRRIGKYNDTIIYLELTPLTICISYFSMAKHQSMIKYLNNEHSRRFVMCWTLCLKLFSILLYTRNRSRFYREKNHCYAYNVTSKWTTFDSLIFVIPSRT